MRDSPSLIPSFKTPTQTQTSSLYRFATISNNRVYFITGANRGIGLEIVKALAADSNNTIIASARDPTKAKELNALASKGNVNVVTLDVSSQESIAELDSQLAKVASDGIDYFISNAGIAHKDTFGPALGVGIDHWLNHFFTNTIGPVLITKVVKPYLSKKETKVIVFVSSIAAAVGGFFNISTSAYGMSKASLNHFVRTLALELREEGFTVIAMHPGVVSTEMGNDVVERAFPDTWETIKSSTLITPTESATQQLAVISKLSRDDTSKFFSYTGGEIAW